MSPESEIGLSIATETLPVKTEVRLSTASLVSPLRPDVPFFWGISKFVEFSDKAGYDGIELIPLRGIARDILKNPSVIDKYLDKIKSGHVIFNPYATFSTVLRRDKDPLRPGKRLEWANLALADADKGKDVLHILEGKIRNFPIVTYNYHPNGKDDKDYGYYRNQWVQTHPLVFNDKSNAYDLVRIVKQIGGHYSGVVFDTEHASQSTPTGERPFSNQKNSVRILLSKGVLREIHLKPFKHSKNHPEKIHDSGRELIGEDIKGKSELRKLILLVKEYGPSIPFVIEAIPTDLYRSGLIEFSSLFLPDGKILDVHKQMVNFIKNVKS